MISKDALLELRKKTGAGVLDCKKALEEADGNIEEAINQIKKKGLSKAISKSEKAVLEGVIFATVSEDMHKGVILELKCETDFVSRNEMYQNLTKKIAELAMYLKIHNKEDLMNANLNGSEKVSEALLNSITAFGENILIGEIFTNESRNLLESYIHFNKKIGVLVEYIGNDKAIAKDIAMHIAAMSPTYLDANGIDSEVINKMKKEYLENSAVDLIGKPKEISEKIIKGKMSKFFENSCLLSQRFVKNPEITIHEYIKDKIEIINFKRIAMGDK